MKGGENYICNTSALGWFLKLKVGKSKLQPPEFILLVKKTLLVIFFLNLTTFTPPLSTLKFSLSCHTVAAGVAAQVTC